MSEEGVKLLKLTRSPRSDDRFYAEFDNGEAFTVTVAIIADFGLYSGLTLDADEFKAVAEAAERSGAKSRALRMLGARPMSEGEIIEKLADKGVDRNIAADTANWLSEIGAVNDEEYARMIVSHYSKKGYGEAKIKSELYRRKVPKELWEDALENMPDTDDIIDRLVETKLRGTEPDRKELKKVSDMLLRRGYSYEEVRGALRRYSENTEERYD